MSDKPPEEIHRLNLDDLVERALEEASEEEESRGYIGASIIGGQCDRAIWYQFRWVKPHPFSGRILKRFETGHAYEPRVIAQLKRIGFEVRDTNPRARNDKKQYRASVLGGLVSGGVDAFVKGREELWAKLIDPLVFDLSLIADKFILGEFKAMISAKYKYTNGDYLNGQPCANRKKGELEGRFWKTKRLGVKLAQVQHYAQMQIYMQLSHELDERSKKRWFEKWDLDEPLDHALYVAVNTDTEQSHAEIINRRPAWYMRAISRAKRVAKMEEPPERVEENPAFEPCKWCDFQHVCHGLETYVASCRNCSFAKLKLPGDRGNFSSRPVWLCEKHNTGLGAFEACGLYKPTNNEPYDEEVGF